MHRSPDKPRIQQPKVLIFKHLKSIQLLIIINDQYKGVEDQFPTYSIIGHKQYSADISIDICEYNDITTGASIAALDIASKLPYWTRNAYSYLWGSAEEITGQVYEVLLYPENNSFFDMAVAPSVSGDNCIFTARLTGYVYDIYDGNAENIIDQLPLVPAGEARKFEITLLISDPGDFYSNDLILTQTANTLAGNPAGITIKPNPAHDRIYVDWLADLAISGTAVIINACGQPVLQDIRLQHGEAIDISTLPPGMYFVQYKTGGLFLFQKLIKL